MLTCMQDTAPLLRGPYVRLRRERFEARVAELGMGTAKAVAAHIGIDPGTFSRLASGDVNPGERFIAAAIASGFASSFDDLFEIAETS